MHGAIRWMTGKTYMANPTWWCLRLIGRLRSGVTKAQAVAQMQPVFQAAAYTGLGIAGGGREEASAEPGRSEGIPRVRRGVWQTFAAADGRWWAWCLLIALTNVVHAADGAQRNAAAGVQHEAGAGRGAQRSAAATADGEPAAGDGGRTAGVALRGVRYPGAGRVGAD